MIQTPERKSFLQVGFAEGKILGTIAYQSVWILSQKEMVNYPKLLMKEYSAGNEKNAVNLLDVVYEETRQWNHMEFLFLDWMQQNLPNWECFHKDLYLTILKITNIMPKKSR